MTREFLKNLGVDDAKIDKILDENMNDIGREKRRTEAAEAKLTTADTALTDANGKLATARTELETLKKANGDIAAVQQQLSNLQAKYDADTADLKGMLADRDYSDAISRKGAEIQLQGRGEGVFRRPQGEEAGAEGQRADIAVSSHLNFWKIR